MNKKSCNSLGAASPVPSLAYLKAKPLASRIGVSAKTLFRWADAGLIHRHKVNDRIVLFDEREVSAFIQKCRI